MKIILVEAFKHLNGSFNLVFEESLGVRPSYPNCIDETGKNVSIGRVGEDSRYIHHIDRDEIRYLIYFNGPLIGDEVEELEKGLTRYLEKN